MPLNLRHAAKSIQPACVGPDGPRCDRQAKPELRDLTGGSGKGTGTLSSRTAVLSGLRGLPAARTTHRKVRCAALLGSLRNGFPDHLDMCLQSPPPSSSSPCVLCPGHQSSSPGALYGQAALASAPLGAHCAWQCRRLGSTAGQSRDAISGPNEAALHGGVERGLALHS